MYLFFESIHWQNGVAANLAFHQKRIDETFDEFFPQHEPIDLAHLIKVIKLPISEQLYKVKIMYEISILDYNWEPYEAKLPTSVYLIEESKLTYQFKFLDRKVFEKIQKKLPVGTDFIITQNGFLTDSSYANLVFFDGLDWYTPTHYLLNGTQKRKLLIENAIKETPIHVKDLDRFVLFKRINAMMPFEASPSLEMQKILVI